jgi:hypothetical protein
MITDRIIVEAPPPTTTVDFEPVDLVYRFANDGVGELQLFSSSVRTSTVLIKCSQEFRTKKSSVLTRLKEEEFRTKSSLLYDGR